MTVNKRTAIVNSLRKWATTATSCCSFCQLHPIGKGETACPGWANPAHFQLLSHNAHTHTHTHRQTMATIVVAPQWSNGQCQFGRLSVALSGCRCASSRLALSCRAVSFSCSIFNAAAKWPPDLSAVSCKRWCGYAATMHDSIRFYLRLAAAAPATHKSIFAKEI